MDLAKKPQMAHGDGLKEQVVGASLLGSHLNDAVGLLGNLAQRLALVDGQRERLLAKYVFAGPQGVDGDFCVPVFGRGDGDGVNVLSVEQFAVVFVDRSLAILEAASARLRSTSQTATTEPYMEALPKSVTSSGSPVLW